LATTCLERELKLEAPPGFRIPDLSGLGRGLSLSSPELRRHVAIYWDTRDLRLTRWDCGLRHRSSDGWTAKLPASGEGAALVRRELRLAGAPERPPVEALELLLGVIRREPLVPVLELHTARERIVVSGRDAREMVEVTNDLVAVMQGGRAARRFREVEVEFSADCPSDVVAEIEWRLRRAGAGRPHQVPKQVRGLGLAGGIDPEVPLPGIGRDATVEELLRHTLARSVVALVRHDSGVRLDEDIEDVHIMRVATRRLRSQLGTFAPLLEPSWSRHLRAELRWLGGELGSVRDADVLGLRLRAAAASLPLREREASKDLLALLAEGRQADRERLLRALRSARYVSLLEMLVDAAREPALLEAGAPAKPLLAPRLEARWRRLRKAVAAQRRDASDLALHAVRIRAKHLRYAAEAATPLLGRPARRIARAAQGMQQSLGDHQDSVVATRWLREAARSVPREAAFVAGVLAAREHEDASAVRSRFDAAWKKLEKSRRGLRKALRRRAAG